MLTARPGSRPPLQARLVAVTLADMAGRAFGAGHYRAERVLTHLRTVIRCFPS
jgi:hypothetical protein